MEAEASKLQCPGRWYGAGTGTGVSFSHIVWYGTGTSTEVSFSHIVWYGTGTSTNTGTISWYGTAANIRHICTVWYGTAAKIRHICNSCVVLKFPFTPRIYVTTQSQCEVSSKTTVLSSHASASLYHDTSAEEHTSRASSLACEGEW